MVEEIIAEHTERFHHWYQSRVAVPVISSIVQSADTVRERELQKLFARCPELTDREKMLITGMSLTIVSKLLHTPITNIRDRALMLDELFDLK
jgi:glutamyl-tRNA reductase